MVFFMWIISQLTLIVSIICLILSNAAKFKNKTVISDYYDK